MKYVIIGFFIGTFIMLLILQKLNLPQITLPKFAQHNTIGELPIVEVMDDGDFYEVDGAEDWSYYNSCVDALTSQCGEKDECIKEVTNACNTKNGVPKCKELVRIGDIFFPGKGIFFSCDVAFNEVEL